MTDRDEQLIKLFRETHSYAETGRKMLPEMDRRRVEGAITRLRAKGIELPEAIGRGKHARNKGSHDRPTAEN